jgi:ABC-type polysaccharide/polyol phosphate export permease
MIVTARETLTGSPLTVLPEFCGLMGITAVLLVIGLIIYHLAMPHIIERMSA